MEQVQLAGGLETVLKSCTTLGIFRKPCHSTRRRLIVILFRGLYFRKQKTAFIRGLGRGCVITLLVLLCSEEI